MKTAMKRLLSLVLVAMMLVSVVPFQASAVTPESGKLIFVDANGSVIATEDPDNLGAGVAANVDGDWYTIDGTNQKSNPKSGLKGKVVYAAGCPIPVTVTISGTVGGTLTKTVNVPFDPTGDSEQVALLAAIKSQIPEYSAIYDDTQTVCSSLTLGDANSEATVTVVPKSATKWDIIVNLNGNPQYTTTADLYTVPTGDTEALKNAVAHVTDAIDKNAYTVTSGEWTINTDNKIASVNVTSTKKVEEYKVTFILCDKYDDSCAEVGKCQTVVIETVNQKLTHTPDLPERYRYQFSGWRNKNTGNMGLQETYTGDVTYEAIYTKKADTNLHKVNVYGVIYSHGKTHTLGSPLVTIYATDGANLLNALKEKTTSIQNELNARGYTVGNKYEWDGNTFYTNYYFTTENEVTSGAKITGDGTYYVKVNYTGTNKVQIYVHTAKTLTIKDTVTLTTYVPGETISKSDVITAVENAGWRYSNFRTYTRDSWEKIVDRDSTSAANETKAFEVVDGETEIHVYLTNSSAAITGDNPKTGDAILMAVTVLGLSAAALAAVYFFSKKKQSM